MNLILFRSSHNPAPRQSPIKAITFVLAVSFSSDLRITSTVRQDLRVGAISGKGLSMLLLSNCDVGLTARCGRCI
jgi:hypothetical protein